MCTDSWLAGLRRQKTNGPGAVNRPKGPARQITQPGGLAVPVKGIFPVFVHTFAPGVPGAGMGIRGRPLPFARHQFITAPA